jgi:hypothetical protein
VVEIADENVKDVVKKALNVKGGTMQTIMSKHVRRMGNVQH